MVGGVWVGLGNGDAGLFRRINEKVAMSTIDQCPSSKKQGLTPESNPETLQTSAGTGRTYWRSLDEVVGTAEFREFLQREFPKGASELLRSSRRTFLKIMGASVALAGAATLPGCRRPEHKIITYHDKPEEIIPGKALFYATTWAAPGGGAEGLLAETYSGRPTKLEGNPLHPVNNGALSVHAQASVLDLYDPDRTPAVVEEMARLRARRGEGVEFTVTPWDDFAAAARVHFTDDVPSSGAGLVFLVEKKTSPTRDRLRDRLLAKYPEAEWLPYEAIDNDNEIVGTRAAFGSARRVEHRLDRADVIVAMDADPLGRDADLVELRGWAKHRIREGEGRHAARDTTMSRMYVAEPVMTLTGGQADHRVAARVGQVSGMVIEIARRVLAEVGGGDAARLERALGGVGAVDMSGVVHGDVFVEHAARELIGARGRGALMVGPNQPASVHAVAAAVNAALGNLGQTVLYRPMPEDASASSAESIARLSRLIDEGRVDTLVTIGVNPVFSAPGDLDFRAKYESVPMTMHMGDPDETAEVSTWHVGRSHFLESWGDAVAWDGTYGVQQPMIRPLFNFRSDIELLAFIGGDDEPDGYELVTATVAARNGLGSAEAEPKRFETLWRKTLHDGLQTATVNSNPARSSMPDMGAVAGLVDEEAGGALAFDASAVDVVFVPHANVLGGRFANNGWLQELPETVTKIAWGLPALIGPETAREAGLRTGRKLVHPQYSHGAVAAIGVEGRVAEIPIWVQPGIAPKTVVVPVGNGRRVVGRVGDGAGYDTYGLRGTGAMHSAVASSLGPAEGRRPELLASTQDHWSMESRDIVREVDLPAWRKFGDELYYEWEGIRKVYPNIGDKKAKKILKTAYTDKRELTFAGRFGMEAHSPELQTPYADDQDHYYVELERTEDGEIIKDEQHDPVIKRDEKGRPVGKINEFGRRVQQWGMTLDMNTCTGCGACVVACQAENNIPIVGKKETAKGREMQWIRIDRYYGTETGSPSAGVGDQNASMYSMPVTCVHCENAPCEVVCPVNATVHGEEGTNNMAYNRCIGTRYCANNCPYKVRRFNMFDYATKQFEGGLGQVADGLEDTAVERNLPSNENFIPPRLREERIEVSNMQYNPNVTVRSRGLMEKCTYCIQRVNESRVEAKLHDLPIIPDGFFDVACQQACPTGAIVFGDIYDYQSHDGKGSRVYRSRKTQRAYALLAYLNTRPRTLHLMRVRNPSEAYLRDAGEGGRIASWDHPFHGGGEKGGGGDGYSGDHGGDHALRLPVLNGEVVSS